MPRRPSLESKWNGKHHVVALPASLAPDGKFARRYFTDEKEADAFAARLRGDYHKGHRGASIDVALAKEAAAAAAILKPFDVTLVEVAKDYARRMKQSGAIDTFEDRYTSYIEANRDEWSPRYLRDFEGLKKRLPKAFLRKRVGEIGEADIAAAVEFGCSGKTQRATKTRLVKAAIANREKRPKAKAPKIFDAKQVKALLKACKTSEEERAVGLMLFGGVRPAAEDGELARLDWKDVRGRHITMRAEVSKTGSERLIVIRPRLLRILKGKPKEGRVVPPQWKKVIRRIRQDAGIDGTEYQDAARHTFASAHLAAFGEDRTKENLGHTAGSRTLFTHYRRAITATQAKGYFI